MIMFGSYASFRFTLLVFTDARVSLHPVLFQDEVGRQCPAARSHSNSGNTEMRPGGTEPGENVSLKSIAKFGLMEFGRRGIIRFRLKFAVIEFKSRVNIQASQNLTFTQYCYGPPARRAVVLTEYGILRASDDGTVSNRWVWQKREG